MDDVVGVSKAVVVSDENEEYKALNEVDKVAVERSSKKNQMCYVSSKLDSSI